MDFDTYREAEKEKYDYLHANNYGVGPVMRVLRFSKSRINPVSNSVIDYGCGYGSLAGELKCASYLGVDVAQERMKVNRKMWHRYGAKFKAGLITDIEDVADVGFCIDVMEHIPQEFVDATLVHICDHTKQQIWGISCREAGWKYKGKQVHLTVKPPKWWIAKLEAICSHVEYDIQKSEVSIYTCT